MTRQSNYPQIVLFATLAVGLSLFCPRLAAAGHGNWQASRAIKQQNKEIQNIQRQLTKKYGGDASYVFQVSWQEPNVSHSVTRVSNGVRYRDLAHTTITAKLETKSFKVDDSAAAALLIWRGNRSPVRFQFRVFKNESDADAFLSSVRNY